MAGHFLILSLIYDVLVYATVSSFLAFIVFSGYIVYVRRFKYAHIPGPVARSFLKGNLPDIKAKLDSGQSSFQFLLECHMEYGNVVLIWLFFLPWVNVVEIADVRNMLVVKNFPKDPRFYKECLQTLFGQRAMGYSLLTNLNDGEWRIRRNLMNPAFQRTYLKNLMRDYNASADIFLEKLHNVSNVDRDVRMVDEFSLVTLDVICKAGFAIDLDVINDPHSPFIQAYNRILKGVEEAFVNPLHKLDVTSYGRQRQAIAGVRFLRRLGRDTIAARRQAMQRGDVTPHDILDHVLRSAERNPTLTEDDLVDDFVTFFSSGHETTSSALSFCLLELAHNKEALARLRHEVDDVLGTSDDVSHDVLSQLHYMGDCLKETLRLYPPAPGIIRVTPHDVSMSGYLVAKGTTVSASPFVMGRHPRYWDEPLEFRPERWQDSGKDTTYTHFPFSLGPRNCIGQVFAAMEFKVIMAKFLRDFDFRLVPGQTKRIHERGSLQPLDGVVCRLTSRKRAPANTSVR